MTPKVAGALAERGDCLRRLRHRPHRGEVVATYSGQWGGQYWSTREPLLVTTTDHYWLTREAIVVCTPSSVSPHSIAPLPPPYSPPKGLTLIVKKPRL